MKGSLNDLVLRVYAAVAKDNKHAEPDIGLDVSDGVVLWWVCYRNSGDWKNNRSGPTLRGALEAWLRDYEHHYDDGPYRRTRMRRSG